MKINLFFTFVTLLLLLTLSLKNTPAQDYTKWELPDGAKSRLGKGVVTDIQISPDNTRLAIASSIGIWLYDVQTGDETAFITRNTDLAGRVVFSPDSTTLASTRGDNAVQIWEVKREKFLLTFSTPSSPLAFLKFLADGKTLVGLNQDGTVRLWDSTTGEQLNTFSPEFSKINIKGSIWERTLGVFVDNTSGVTFAIGNHDGTISIQDGRTHQQIRTLVARTDDAEFFVLRGEPNISAARKPARNMDDDRNLPTQYRDDGTPFPIQYWLGHPNRSRPVLEEQPMKWVTKLEFSPDGKTLVNRSEYRIAEERGWRGTQGPIEIWDVDTGEQLAALPAAGVNGIQFSGDGKTLAITGSNGCAIWDIKTRRETNTFQGVVDVKFSGDGKTLIITESDNYGIWDLVTQRKIAVLRPIQAQFASFSTGFVVSQDGTFLATADANGTVHLWETKTGTQMRTLTTGYTETFTALAFAPNGKTLASGDDAGNIQFWNPNTGKKKITIKIENKKIGELAFAKDGTTLTTVSNENITVWNVTTGKQIAAYTIPDARSWEGEATFSDGTRFRLKGLAFTPYSDKLVTRINKGTSSIYEVWDLTTGKHPRSLTEVEHQFGPVALAPDGNMLVKTGKWSDTPDLWSTHTGEWLATLNISNKIYALKFSPDGKTLAVGTGDREVQLWDVSTHSHLRTLNAHKHAICELAFSPDGKTLASGDTGGKIHLWKIPTHKHLTTFDGHKRYIRTLAFSPDGKTLASISGNEGTILLWNVPTK